MPRRPPHFKVFVSIQNHPKMRGVYDSDALLAMYVRAGIMAIERYADRTHDCFLVGRRDLMRVAATEPWANAQKKLLRLEAATPLQVRCDCPVETRSKLPEASQRLRSGLPAGSQRASGTPLSGRCGCSGIWLDFPNLSKKQFSRGGNGAETESSSSATSTSTSSLPTGGTAPPERGAPPRGKEAAGDVDVPPESTPEKARAKGPARRRRTQAPDRLSDEQRAALRKWASSKHPWAVQRIHALESKCLGHHRAKGNLMADWYQCVQNWIDREPEMNPRSAASRQPRASPRGSRAPLTERSLWDRYNTEQET